MKKPIAGLTATLLLSSAVFAATAVAAQTSPKSPAKAASQPAAAAPAASPASSAATGLPADPEKEQAGALAAGGWLVLLDRKDWGTAWETSSAVFRGTVPLASWMDGIPKVREPLGALVDRVPGETQYRTTLQGRPPGEYVTVVFYSRFDQKPEVAELVTTVRDTDGRWRVTGYSTR